MSVSLLTSYILTVGYILGLLQHKRKYSVAAEDTESTLEGAQARARVYPSLPLDRQGVWLRELSMDVHGMASAFLQWLSLQRPPVAISGRVL